MYIGAVIAFSISPSKRVAGQVIMVNHREATIKLMGRQEILLLADWIGAYGRGDLEYLLSEHEAILFRKTVVRSELVRGPIRWYRRLIGWWRWTRYERCPIGPRIGRLSWAFAWYESRQLVTGVCCMDGYLLPYARCGSPDYIYDERYNLLQKNYPDIWKKWTWQSNLFMS